MFKCLMFRWRISVVVVVGRVRIAGVIVVVLLTIGRFEVVFNRFEALHDVLFRLRQGIYILVDLNNTTL